MIKSMTGYGKAEAILAAGKLTVEIRTLNSKSADIGIKSSLLPKDKDILVRQKIAEKLVRGTIDVYLTLESSAAEAARTIDADMVRAYCDQVAGIRGEVSEEVFAAILRFPDIISGKKEDVINEENWPLVESAFDKALNAVDQYRDREGLALYKDVTGRVQNILELELEVESHEKERVDAVRERILKAAEELNVKLDKERFEQEMIFWLEKYDINEEKVRLRQHCSYFMDTINGEAYPGKKLGFIIQEMGREINTTGSKANHAGIQRLVVRMKDELEKIREQSMNIL